jgi:glycine/D-amino acid oxidase-like deaminating enzyme
MKYDVIIVGGGSMGASTAYYLLMADPTLSVAVVERDSTYEHASTILSDGNVRVQFHLEENIRMSQFMLDTLDGFSEAMATENFIPEATPRRQGNLFMVDDAHRKAAMAGLTKQRNLGCDVEWLDPEEIGAAYPTYQTIGLAGGTIGHDDGSVDPTAVLRGYRAKSAELGASYIDEEVAHLLVADHKATGVKLSSEDSLVGDNVVVTAGAWTADLLQDVGIEVPVRPVMRTVYVVSTPFPSDDLPSVFLPSGVYAIGEGGNTWLIGWSRPEDPVGFEFVPAGRERFENLIWPELIQALPAFEELRVERSWAGLYAVNTLDGNGIFGEWPGFTGLSMATGFSGHGFQQCAAVGQNIAESILGLEHTLDLARLGPERIIRNEPVYEHEGLLI